MFKKPTRMSEPVGKLTQSESKQVPLVYNLTNTKTPTPKIQTSNLNLNLETI